MKKKLKSTVSKKKVNLFQTYIDTSPVSTQQRFYCGQQKKKLVNLYISLKQVFNFFFAFLSAEAQKFTD